MFQLKVTLGPARRFAAGHLKSAEKAAGRLFQHSSRNHARGKANVSARATYETVNFAHPQGETCLKLSLISANRSKKDFTPASRR